MNTVKRNSAVELLRIFCILLVIAGHYYAHGIAYAMAPFTWETYSPRILILQLISFGADIANDIFIIITGYYMICSEMKGKRILRLLGEMFFYSWLIALVFYKSGLAPFSKEGLLDSLIPIWSGYSWFVTCYLILCLLIPFLNPFLKNLEKKAYGKLLLLLFLLRFVTPILDTKTFWNTTQGLEQFIFLYFIGAYLRLYGFKSKFLQNKWNCRVLLVLLVGLWAAVSAGIALLGCRRQDNELLADVTKYYPIFSVTISTVLLIVVLGIKPFYSRVINTLSGSVLAVYLIHDHPLVRQFLWWTVSPNINQIGSDHIFLHLAQKAAAVFLVCVLIDQCRIWLLEKPLQKFFQKNRPLS